MPLVTGTLTDFGLDPLTINSPQLLFRASSTGLTGLNLLSSHKAVRAFPAADGEFSVDLVATSLIAPDTTHYTVEIRFRDTETGMRISEVLPWKLLVPPEGGALGQLLRVPANPALVWTGEQPPILASPGTWWLDPSTGELSELTQDGTEWAYKANLRGPAGYNATGAAEDDAAVAAFINGSTATKTAAQSLIKAEALPKWKPSTNYTAGDRVVHPSGDVKVAKTTHTSSSTSPGTANWQDPPALAAEITTRQRDLFRQRGAIRRANPRRPVREPMPAGLGFDPGLTVFYNGARYFTNYDVAARRNTGGRQIYVNTVTGLNTNAGTAAAPYLSLNNAVTQAVDGDEIIIANKGICNRNQIIITGENIGKSVNIVAAYPGETYLTTADSLVYTPVAGSPGLYTAARTNVLNVVDLGPDPEGFWYDKLTTQAAAAAQPGSWYHDGTNVFINTLDGQTPDNSKILALLDSPMMSFVGDARTSPQRVYLQGLNILGPQNGIKVSNISAHRTQFTAKDTKFLFSGKLTADAVPVLGNVDCYTQRCTLGMSAKDGLNYHGQGGYVPHFVEIDNHGHSNGLRNTAGDYSMNASTAHDGAKGIRIGGRYHHTMGTPVADVNAGTKVAMFSCDMWDSLAPAGNAFNAAVSAQQAGAEIWLYGCRMFDAELSIYAVAGSTVHIINSEYDTINTAGTIDIVSAL